MWHVAPGDLFPVVVQPSNRADGNLTWMFKVLGRLADGQVPDLVLGNYRYLRSSQPQGDAGKEGMFRLAVDDEAQGRLICLKVQALFATSSTLPGCVPVRDDPAQLMAAGANLRDLRLAVARAGLFMVLFQCGSGIAESVRERLPELAALKTCGFTDGTVAALVLAKAAIPAVTCALLGCGCAWIIEAAVSQRAEALQGIPPLSVTAWVLACAVAAGWASPR